MGNEDNLLGRKGGADFNFYDGKLRVFDGKQDRLAASRPPGCVFFPENDSCQSRIYYFLNSICNHKHGKH